MESQVHGLHEGASGHDAVMWREESTRAIEWTLPHRRRVDVRWSSRRETPTVHDVRLELRRMCMGRDPRDELKDAIAFHLDKRPRAPIARDIAPAGTWEGEA